MYTREVAALYFKQHFSCLLLYTWWEAEAKESRKRTMPQDCEDTDGFQRQKAETSSNKKNSHGSLGYAFIFFCKHNFRTKPRALHLNIKMFNLYEDVGGKNET